MSKKYSWYFLLILCLVVVGLMVGSAYGAPGMPSSGEKSHMNLIGYNDLQGRETLQITVRGNWAYAGHHNRPGSVPIHHNPLTGFDEENGTTILDISNPARPVLVAHIPNFENRNSRSATTVYDFKGSGRDYLVRNSEGATAPRWKFEIFDITDRADGIDGIYKVGEITGTPYVPACRCGGAIQSTAHKGYISQSGKFYAGADEFGFRDGQHLIVYDLSDALDEQLTESDTRNFNDTFIGRAWLPGQKLTEPAPADELGGHHPIVDEARNRVYMAYLTGGNVVSWDIGTNSGAPNYQYPVKWTIDNDPPGSETHTVTVIEYEEVPNFEPEFVGDANPTGLPRLYALVSDEATSNSYWRFNDDPPGVRSPIREKAYMFDVTHADETGVPFPIETWQVPNADYIMRGGRFGPHQFNETIDSEFNLFEDKIAFFAYFNAGVRAVDISNPYELKEVGYYVPQENERCGFIGGNQPSPNIQTNDVTVDSRGLVYASDRVGCGLYILEFKK